MREPPQRKATSCPFGRAIHRHSTKGARASTNGGASPGPQLVAVDRLGRDFRRVQSHRFFMGKTGFLESEDQCLLRIGSYVGCDPAALPVLPGLDVVGASHRHPHREMLVELGGTAKMVGA